MKLPERRWLPSGFKTGSDSPVKRDSFTSASPTSITQSEQTWFPASNSITSCSTNSWIGISECFPSRITLTVGADKSESFSTSFLACSSCTIPIRVLTAIMQINIMLDHAPTRASAMAINTLNRLNRVQMLSFKIWLVDLVDFSGGRFCFPLSFFCWTCTALSPVRQNGLSGFPIQNISVLAQLIVPISVYPSVLKTK